MSNEPKQNERALVLGGGGSAGNAWLIGVVAGLFDAGLDATKADLIIGTSAGSTAAAQITSATPTELFAAAIAAPQPRTTPAPSRGSAPMRPAANHNQVERLSAIIAASKDAADMRRKLGAAAFEAEATSDSTAQARWRTTVAARLPNQHWSKQAVQITAVDAHTGGPIVFDSRSGVDLVDAVAASCAGGGFAYSIGSNHYIDGGYRSNAENADLAAGYARVLILSPFSGRSLQPSEWGTHLSAQIDNLRAGGSKVETVFPDGSARDIFTPGGNVMDPSSRLPAAQAGYDQGKALAARLAHFWH
jgi:NTE family protein